MVPEMAYTFCPTGVPPDHLKLKRGAPFMVIRNLLQTKIVNGKMFLGKMHTRKIVHIASVDSSGQDLKILSL